MQLFAFVFEQAHVQSLADEHLALMTLFLGVITVCRFVFGFIGRGADMLQDYVSLEVLGLGVYASRGMRGGLVRALPDPLGATMHRLHNRLLLLCLL